MTPVVDEERDEPDPLIEALAATPAGGVVPRGTVIDGQYKVERVLGEGGMGVVYLARDLKLDREVAIKVGIERSAAAIGRLAREAMALARLSHPNVVVIHQVGELGGRAFVAMEYVPGGTARTWCQGKGRREVVALYIAAGEGLAAAHAAGLVHRDFKPDNVLVGADGRPRVADFGLARVQLAAGVGAGMTGALGTPAYMAPEQFGDGEVDARADQFALCASLWEALFGERPFAERTTEREAIRAEPVRGAGG
ncbi:MAG: serine/threonine protein kinase, partial [Deltaproteobacteria bacterium]|nr:serine/threonine protein kinase [Deltaproteobacteria bacterium]